MFIAPIFYLFDILQNLPCQLDISLFEIYLPHATQAYDSLFNVFIILPIYIVICNY